MKERIDMQLYKIIISLLFFIGGLFAHNQEVISFGLFLVSYLIIGYDVILDAIKNIFEGEIFDEKFLMTIATLGAFVIREFPEGVAVILFFQVGEYLQARALEKSKNMVLSLASMKSDTVIRRNKKKEETVSIEDVEVGDLIVVSPGEVIALDGVVVEGSSTLDMKAITGESMPCDIGKNATVISGSINLTGLLLIQVTNDVTTSTVSKILDLMENANRNKTKTEKFITKFSKLYTPIVVILALMITLVPVFTGGSFQEWIYRALVFLTISCPCALVISIPLGFLSGLGVLSKHGVLVKGTNHLENLARIDTVIFDKTGTLTEGVFRVQKCIPKKGKKEELLRYASLAEQYSNHPIAHAILDEVEEEISKEDLSAYQEIAGKGISVIYRGKELLVGNSLLLKENKISFSEVKEMGTVIYVSYDRVYKGAIVVSDSIRSDAKEMIQNLKNLGIERFIILSGDHKNNVRAVAKELGIIEYYASLLPNEKVEKLEIIKKEAKGKVMFVGDGINDAPVLIHSDLGVSMGLVGSDAAIETSDMILMKDSLSVLPTSISIAKKIKRIVWQNIIFAIFMKVLVLLFGALGFANIWFAVFADVGVTILTILYSFTIYLKEKN